MKIRLLVFNQNRKMKSVDINFEHSCKRIHLFVSFVTDLPFELFVS